MDSAVVLSANAIAVVPIVVALTSLAKMYIDSRWAPLISLALGIASAFVVPSVAFFGSPLLGGIVIGLAASGLYSGAKTVAGY